MSVPGIAINRKINLTNDKVEQLKLDITIPGSKPASIRNL